MKTYFISDLHLKPQAPQTIQAFLGFLARVSGEAEKLYILGDLFEAWVGDDGAESLGAMPLLNAMRQASQHMPCYFIAGNRDFLVRSGFADASGFCILPDESVIDLYGKKTLILHGDSLCTDDVKHQIFRQEVTTNQSKCDELLSLPLAERLAMAQQARGESQTNNPMMSAEIMDVTEAAVVEAFRKYEVQQMIHGHTHRQNIHRHQINGHEFKRYVLGDWGETGSMLVAGADELSIKNFPIG